MARVKVCGCGHSNPRAEMFCLQCGSTLANVDDQEAGPETVRPAPGRPPEARPMTTREAVQGARLSFDWGDERIDDYLLIGRDSAVSPIAERLTAFPTVSGRHAELRPAAEGVRVLHLGATNPTYVDGRALSSGESAIARNGSRISFSRAVTCVLVLDEE